MVIHPVSHGNTLWLFNIAMQNDPFIDDVPIQMFFFFHGYVGLPQFIYIYIHIAVYIHIQSNIYIYINIPAGGLLNPRFQR